jgi:protein SCO1/2
MGLMYAISGEADNYSVDHSASLVLINPAGKIAAIFKPEQAVGEIPNIDSDKLLSDYQKIVALY